MALDLTSEQLKKLRKEVQKEARSKSKSNPNLSFNLFIIREVYSMLARKAGISNATKNLYEYLGCNDKDYEHMISNAYCYPEVVEKFEKIGVSRNHLRSDSATRIPVSESLEDLYIAYDLLKENKKAQRRKERGNNDVFDDEDALDEFPSMTLIEFREHLKFLFSISDKGNNLLFILCNKMVQEVYNEVEPAENRVADFFSALAEIEIDGSDIRTKELYKNLVEIAESYIDAETE